MKIFNFKKLIIILVAAELIFAVSGCDNISQGLQRRKFEFLYRMNSDVTLLREYTVGINVYGDLDFYEKKISKLYSTVNKSETIDGYGESKVFKENFLTLLDDNLKTVNALKLKELQPDDIIKNEYDVIIMKENVTKFIEDLNQEIVRVGKE